MRTLAGVCALIVFVLSGWCRGADAEEMVPRTVIALYNGGEPRNTYIHKMVELPLNHLGLIVEYHDIHDPLPAIADRKDVRGVLTWFYSDAHMDPEKYLKWGIGAINSGKKFVVLGALGIDDEKRRTSASSLVDNFIGKIGIKSKGYWVGKPFDATYEMISPDMVLSKSTYEWLRAPYEVVQAVGDQTEAHVVAHGKKDDASLIVTSPNGGYVADGYIFRTNDRNGSEVSQWLINPFEFFRLAFGTDDLPKPDTTTIAGRRIYYSHIDGDGWNNVTRLEEYRDKKMLSAEVIMKKAVEAYPDLPVMLAIIGADIDPKWVGTPDSRAIAQKFLALPQVEAGSHTYSHPFFWDFFKDGNAQNEIPYLNFYPTSPWQPKNITVKAKYKPPEMPAGYSTPRAYAAEPFEIHKEIQGAVDEIAPLLPKNKHVEIIAWPGNCAPWEGAIHLTREAHIQNINGGDNRFDAEFPNFASVAPIGLQVGKELQIYSSSSNENTYTDLWSKNFHAYAYVKESLKNTESPMRLKPIDLYYHIYSGERESSLQAILGDLAYADAQDIAPVTSSHFTHIAEGFYGAELVNVAPDKWRVDNRGDLETIRFDRSTLKAVDFENSEGVIGQRYFQGSLYVYLDAAVSKPVIALHAAEHYAEPAQDKIPYLIESRWLVSSLSRKKDALEFSAQGYGAGEMIWQMPASGTWRISVNGEVKQTIVAQDRFLRLKLNDDAKHPVHVTITGINNA